jgi:integrase/recombinase XerD
MATPRVNLLRIKTRKGLVYQLDYRINGKRFRPKVGSDKHAAELTRKKVESDILYGTYDLASRTSKSINLDALITEYLKSKKHQVRASSLKRYKNYFDRVSRFFSESFPAAASDIRLIETFYLREFIDNAIEAGANEGRAWSRRTVNDSIKIIRSLFAFAIDNNYAETNPAEQIAQLRLTGKARANAFSDEEMVKVWATVDPHWVDPLKFISHTGLRKAELIHLRWESVDLTPGMEQITVECYDDFETKTGESRPIPLNAEAVEIIKRQKGKNAELVFTSKEGHRIHPDKIYHAMKDALEILGLKGDVHKLRHTFCSNLGLKNIDGTTITELMGHSDPKTTQIYLHTNDRRLREAVGDLVNGGPGEEAKPEPLDTKGAV